MGRGNYYARGGDYSYQWYVDNNVWNWDDDPENIRAMLMARYKSFGPCDKWLDRESYVFAQNRLFYVGIADNEWGAAIFLTPRDDGFVRSVQRRYYPIYKAAIEALLCDLVGAENVRIRTSAWTSQSLAVDDETKGA